MSRSSRIVSGLILTSLVALSYSPSLFAQSEPAPPENPQNMLPEPEVLEKGPIHEAFAEPLTFGEQETQVVTKEPPQPIKEIPPETRPEGRNVEWIPGYFQFDPERDDFVWVSGLYRDVPPGRTWVPGEWQQVDDGWQRIPGFWAGEDQQLSLLPNPPESLETGPTSPAPGEDYLWAPGCWQWQDDGYAWQAGFWYQGQQDWVWVPNHYNYASGGSVYVNGYWDYPVQSRGWLYAPVYWSGGYGGYGNNYYYRPRSLINTGLLLANLFVNNRYGGYYYGYGGGGYPGWLQPWGSNYGNWGYYGRGGKGRYGGYDPLWAHNRWHDHRGDGDHRGNWDRDGNWNRDRDRDGRGNRDRSDRDYVERDGRSRSDRNDISGNIVDGRNRRDRDLITTSDKLVNSEGNRRKAEKLSASEVAKVRSRAEKYSNFDRSRIGLGSDAPVRGQRNGSSARVEGNKSVQGRILRQGDSDGSRGQGDSDGSRGNLRGQANVDLSDRNRGNTDRGNLNRGNTDRGNLEARIRSGNQTELGRGQRNSNIRSNTQVEGSTRVQRDGRSLDLGNSSQLRGSVNQRNQGSRQGDASSQSGRRELFYRGAPQEGSNQRQQLQQRSQQRVPNTRSLQGSNRQNIVPQGNIRRGGSSSNAPNIRSNSRSIQGGQRAIQQSRGSSSQNRSSFRGGGNSGGSSRSFSGNRGGGGGGQRASGGNRGGGGGGSKGGGGGKKGR